MKTKLVYLFNLVLIFGCSFFDMSSSHVDYPKNEIFIESIVFQVGIIDVAEKNINNKNELLEYFNNNYLPDTIRYPYNYDTCLLRIVAHGGELESDSEQSFNYIVYIDVLCDGKSVLNKTDYKNGMPILMECKGKGSATGYKVGGNKLLSKQRVVLVKGNPDYWADISFRYGEENEFYTILPVSDGVKKDAKLNFTYSIEKI
jgi:hypothetical protein